MLRGNQGGTGFQGQADLWPKEGRRGERGRGHCGDGGGATLALPGTRNELSLFLFAC